MQNPIKAVVSSSVMWLPTGLVALLAALGCGGSDNKSNLTTPSDAGPDVSQQDGPNVSTPDAASDGEPDGAGDAGSDAPVDSGDSDASDAASDGPLTIAPLPQACLDCIQAYCGAAVGAADYPPCSVFSGNAPGGPAQGVPNQDLCVAAFNCFWTSQCAAAEAVGGAVCYCGSAATTFDVCASGGGDGHCRTEMEYGLYTSDFATIVTHEGDTSLPAGMAYFFLRCAADNCPSECKP
jgi:hypothetical protein